MLKILGKISLVDNVIVAFVREDLSSFRSSFDHPVCDICHRNHNRYELFIVDEDGKRYTAGKNCLEKKLGATVVRRAFEQASVNEKNIALNSYKTLRTVMAAIAMYKEHGFQKGKSNSEFKTHYDDYALTSVCGKYANEAANVIEYIKNIKSNNSFIISCKDLVANEWHSEKVLGLFPAMVNVYYQGKAKEKLSAETKEYGSNGDKVKGVDIQCELLEVRKSNVEDYLGVRLVHQSFLKDNDGHVFVWNNLFDNDGEVAKTGDKITLHNFTVKNHFTGVYGKTTVIVRPKYTIQ